MMGLDLWTMTQGDWARARARVLLRRYRPAAYFLAGERARIGQDGHRRDRHASAVAVEIAALDGRAIGLMTRDRWR